MLEDISFIANEPINDSMGNQIRYKKRFLSGLKGLILNDFWCSFQQQYQQIVATNKEKAPNGALF